MTLYRLPDGTIVSDTPVGKNPKYFQKAVHREGSLSKYGWRIHALERTRRRALRACIRDVGHTKCAKKVGALVGVNKHHPETRRKLERDLAFLRTL